jgi:hypothetical protein
VKQKHFTPNVDWAFHFVKWNYYTMNCNFELGFAKRCGPWVVPASGTPLTHKANWTKDQQNQHLHTAHPAKYHGFYLHLCSFNPPNPHPHCDLLVPARGHPNTALLCKEKMPFTLL